MRNEENVSVVRFKFRCNIIISGKISKEVPGSVASGTPCITYSQTVNNTMCDRSGWNIKTI